MKYKFPKVGMRMVKTAVAVFICLLITFIRPESVPIYSTITAVLCMQPYLSNTKEIAINRIVGTLIGGLAGMLVLMFMRSYIPWPTIQFGIVSICMIPLIYVTLVINHSSASAFTCIVFLGTTIAATPDTAPYIIASYRMFDTLIGILVALVVNAFHLPVHRNRSVLFVSELDNTLLHSDGKITSYTEFHINRMIDDGEWFTIVTDRTPATLVPILENLNLNLPVIAMNGAVLYDVQDRSYSFSLPMDREVSDAIESVFEEERQNCFVHAIINETMHIYYGDFKNTAEERFYHRLRRTSHKNYVFGGLPEDQQAVNITSVNEESVNNRIRKKIEALDIGKRIEIINIPSHDAEGYTVMDIYSADATRENAILKMKKDLSVDQIVAFGSSSLNVPTFKLANRAYAVENAARALKEAATQTISNNDSDAVVKMIDKIFYRKKGV